MFFKLFVQIVGFIGTFFYFVSFQFKDTKKLFRVQFLSYIFYIIHFFLLKAYTGSLSYIVGLLKSFCLSSENGELHSKNTCVLLCILQVIIGIITYTDVISILPIIANVAAVIAGFSNNGAYIRFVGIFINSPLWIVYNVVVKSFAGVVDEILTEISMIVSVFRYGFKNLDSK